MKRFILAALALFWVGMIGLLVTFEQRRAAGDPPEFARYPLRESKSCLACHEEIYRQWESSPHGRAFHSIVPRQMSFSDKEETCLPCHAAEPVLMAPPGAPPLTRPWLREEGISCVTCHQVAEGMASSRSVRGACNPVHTPALTQVELCQSCHNAHGTVDQWRASRFAAEGKDCLSCHMPAGDHRMLGAHDSDSLRRAVELRSWLSGQRVGVEVSNRGAAHNLPSGRRSRSMELVVRFLPSGRVYRQRFRNPFKGEAGENTQIPSGETRRFEFAAEGDQRVEVRLIYQFRPSQPDSAGVLLHEAELDLK